MDRSALFVLISLAIVGLASSASAHEPEEEPKAEPRPPKDHEKEQEAIEVTIQAEKPGSEAASRVVYGRRELELRPRLRPGDILEAVPGLFAVQHAGGGKANQYFLRGFDADHGTDPATRTGHSWNWPSCGDVSEMLNGLVI